MMDRVKQKVIMCNQRIANLTEHINNTNPQVSEMNAILREQSQSITMLTGAMPVIQEGVANLRTTIQNDVASKLRAKEETIARTLATLRRESNTAQDVTATGQRESISQITARIVQLFRAPNPDIRNQLQRL
jgi:chromosome segregation ATPase